MLRGEVCDAEPAAFKLVEEFGTLLSGESLARDRSLNLFHAAHLTPSTRPSARWGTDDAYVFSPPVAVVGRPASESTVQ